MNLFDMTSLDSQPLFFAQDDERLQEWLNLDQAGEDIGLPQPFLSPSDGYPFDSSVDPHSILHKLFAPPSQMSLDPSVIMGASSPLPQLDLPSLPTPGSPDIPVPPLPSRTGHAAYPLDPLLASATIQPSTRSISSPPPLSLRTKPLPLTEFRQPMSPKTENHGKFMLSPTRSLTSPTKDSPESSSCVSHKRTHSHPHALVDVPDWEDKPSAEEYKMLSSKEKRQLRNKISARNFRHRRKEHISTLEQQLVNRDKIIDSLRHELCQARSENTELKSEIDLLKLKWSDLMKKIEEMSLGASPSSPQPASIPLPLSPRSRPMTKAGSLMLQMPNLHKDVGTHSRKPFNGVGGMTGGGNVGVHTTLIPEMPIDVYCNPVVPSKPPSTTISTCDTLVSPQALLEQKLLTKTLSPTVQPIPSNDYNPNLTKTLTPPTPSSINSKTSDVPDSCTILTPEDLGIRLGNIVADAFTANRVLNEELLLGCLDGRWELRVVECAPPPYVSPTPTASIDSLSRQFSRIGIENSSAAAGAVPA